MFFRIRKATVNDFEAVYSFICRLEKTAFKKKLFRSIFLKNLSLEHIHYYLAEQQKPTNKKAIGFITIHIQHELHHCAKVAEIMELFVDEGFRGLGIGAALVTAAIGIAKKNKCDVIELSTNKKRKRAHRFYERENFKKTHFRFTMKL